MWTVEYSRSALRQVRKLPRNVSETIQNKIAVLAVDPYAPNNKASRLQGRSGYRLRVGDWRVLYEIESHRLLILDIKPRGGAYQ